MKITNNINICTENEMNARIIRGLNGNEREKRRNVLLMETG